MSDKPEITLPGGGSSSQCPPYETIPAEALDALALRIARGMRNKGKACWNGISENRETALTKEFVLNRLGHLLKHTMLAIDRVNGRIPNDPEETADGGDAGAILWAGAMLAVYEASEKVKDKPIVYMCDTGRCMVCGYNVFVSKFEEHTKIHQEATGTRYPVYFIVDRVLNP